MEILQVAIVLVLKINKQGSHTVVLVKLELKHVDYKLEKVRLKTSMTGTQ